MMHAEALAPVDSDAPPVAEVTADILLDEEGASVNDAHWLLEAVVCVDAVLELDAHEEAL